MEDNDRIEKLLEMIQIAFSSESFCFVDDPKCKVLEIICELHNVDAAAYFEAEWNKERLILKAAYPESYHKKLLKIDDKKLSLKNNGNSILAVKAYNARKIISIEDTKRLPLKVDTLNIDTYYNVDDEIKSEIAIPISEKSKENNDGSPIGILVLNKHENYDYDSNEDLLTTNAFFELAVKMKIYQRHEKAWKKIFIELRNYMDETNLSKFFSDAIDALDALEKYEPKVIKYISIWTVSEKFGELSLIKQKIKDFKNPNNEYDSNIDLKSIYNEVIINNKRHSFYDLFLSAYKKYKEIKGNSKIQDKMKKFPFKIWNMDDDDLIFNNKKEFMEHYNLLDSDKVITFPIFSDHEDEKKCHVRGLIAIYFSNQYSSFFDEDHLRILSFTIGDGIETILRNKKRNLNSFLDEHSGLVISEYNRFIKFSINKLRELIKAEVIIYFSRGEDKDNAIILREYSIDDKSEDQFIKSDDNNKINSNSHNPISEVFNNFKNFKEKCYSCSSDDIFSKNKCSIKEYGESADKCTNCILMPIISKENECIAIVAIKNKISAITETSTRDGNKKIELVENFSRDDERLLKNFIINFGMHSSLKHYYKEAQMTSMLQSHEIVSNAQAISNHAEYFRKNREDEDLFKKKIWDVERWGKNILMLTQIREILDIKKDKLKIRKVKIKEELNNWRPMLKNHLNDYVKEPNFDIGFYLKEINSDPKVLSIVIQNLIKNAIYYSYFCTPVIIEAYNLGNNVEIKFINYGLEISEEDIKENIWRRTYRSEEAKKIRDGGTGIGLFVIDYVRKELELIEIDVTSDLIFRSRRNAFLLYFLEKNKDDVDYYPSDIKLEENERQIVEKILKEKSETNISNIDKYFKGALKEILFNGITKSWSEFINKQIYKTCFKITLLNKKK